MLRAVRDGKTPVAFARAVGRGEEAIVLTNLAQADPGLADMSTLVLIGSSQTRVVAREIGRGFVYTPRSWGRE